MRKNTIASMRREIAQIAFQDFIKNHPSFNVFADVVKKLSDNNESVKLCISVGDFVGKGMSTLAKTEFVFPRVGFIAFNGDSQICISERDKDTFSQFNLSLIHILEQEFNGQKINGNESVNALSKNEAMSFDSYNLKFNYDNRIDYWFSVRLYT